VQPPRGRPARSTPKSWARVKLPLVDFDHEDELLVQFIGCR